TPSFERKRFEALFTDYERQVHAQTHQLFWWLFLAQWAAAALIAAVWSPRTWAGVDSAIHPHLIAAVAIGGLLVIPPLFLIRSMPHAWLTRHVVAVAQLSFSALLIHLSGGRIETHFHVFGSLAFLALYRDWRVMISATLVVTLDHLLRGLWFPESVYGVPFATAWRTVEHAGWVIFEVLVLTWACIVSRREMGEICRREEQNQQLLEQLEQRVRDRTAALEAEVHQHECTTAELRLSEQRYRTLVENAPIGIFSSTRAGEVRFANPYLLRLVGLPVDTPFASLNLSAGHIMRQESRDLFWSRLEADGEVRGFETVYLRPDGTRVEVVLNGQLTGTTDGSPAVCEGTVEDVTARNRAKRDLEKVHHQFVVASRQAGMADVATGVLHNVGNVLTSVNVTTQDLLERLRNSRLSMLGRIVNTIQRERPQLATFLTENSSGRRLPELLEKLDEHLNQENAAVRRDVESLVRHFTHIREVIVTQQSTARLFGVREDLDPSHLFEDALRLITDSLSRHGVTLERDFSPTPVMQGDRHKVLQILVNLIKNAKDSVLAAQMPLPKIIVRVAPGDAGFVALSVEDNGLGIPEENLAKIFSHGFTTKKDGHGFGLHSCVLSAREMKGDLSVASAGAGCGATFTLTLPATAP
ncbi:MAG TPA: ATP-binding protein, partial [Opitutus sp.]|nr:ATP-binding protein [Opitutus sp.]